MTLTFSLLSVLLSIVSAAYLQLPTFILALGYRWFHQYKLKRWCCRLLCLGAFTIFVCTCPPWVAIAATAVPVFFFLVFSMFNANPNVYIALNEKQIFKLVKNTYSEETEVLGYVDESGNAIAYPLEQLVKPRHLLNDTFMGQPLLVSYCMACRSAMVYYPVVEGMRLHFDVLGVYRRNMVMADRETGTIWQQGTGEALYGGLKGSQLTYLPYQQMNIAEWLWLYPASLVAAEAENVKNGIFSKERLMRMMKVTESLVAPGKTDLQGLPLREKVFGVQVGSVAKAYPVMELKEMGHAFADYIGGTAVTVDYNSDTNYISVTETASGKQLVAQSHWWFGWKEFHPNTEIWRA